MFATYCSNVDGVVESLVGKYAPDLYTAALDLGHSPNRSAGRLEGAPPMDGFRGYEERWRSRCSSPFASLKLYSRRSSGDSRAVVLSITVQEHGCYRPSASFCLLDVVGQNCNSTQVCRASNSQSDTGDVLHLPA